MIEQVHRKKNKNLFQHSHHHYWCIFLSDEQEIACHAHKNLNQQRWPTVIIAEMHHPLPPRAVSRNIQQMLMNVSGAIYSELIQRSKSADMIKTLVKICTESRPERMTVCQVLFPKRLDVIITLRGDFSPKITLCKAAVTLF